MAILILILLSLILAFGCFVRAFYSVNRKPKDPYALLNGPQYEASGDKIRASTRIMDAAEFETVTIRSYDGTRLTARYYHHKDGAPVKIFFHGYRSTPLRDCAGGYIIAKKHDINVLAVDHRAHGGSGGHVITFGIRERQDCRCWAEYAASRFGNNVPIILSGLSMGAATVIMATKLQLPPSVACVLADCPYSSPRKILFRVSRKIGVHPWISYPFLWLGALLFGGFNLEKASAENAVKSSPIPIMIFHGEDDRLVPCQMSMDMKKISNGSVQLSTFPEAGHGLSYMIDPCRYEADYLAFLNAIPALKTHLDVVETAQNSANTHANI